MERTGEKARKGMTWRGQENEKKWIKWRGRERRQGKGRLGDDRRRERKV